MSNAPTPQVQATFHAGTFVDQDNWSAAYNTFTVNGQDAGFTSDAIFVLVDDHGIDFDVACQMVYAAADATVDTPAR